MTAHRTTHVAGRFPRCAATLRRVRRDGRRADGGFTLIEAIVSFTIFAIVSAAAVLALVTGVRSNNDTSDRVTAAQLAQQATDRARAMPKPALTASPTVTTTELVGNKSYAVTRTVTAISCPSPSATPTGTDVHTMRVSVQVTIPGDTARTVRVNSVLAC